MWTLSDVPTGKTVIVREISGGFRLRKRLREMGITPGRKVKIIANPGHGPVIIGVDHLRFAIGKGMAHKITVDSPS